MVLVKVLKTSFLCEFLNITSSYKKAYNSLSSWPGELRSAQDAKAVPYIGKGMVTRFEAKLQENGLMPVSSSQVTAEAAKSKSKPEKKQKQYIPTFRSGAHAILLALLEGGESMSKSEIIKNGQVYCDSSFTIPESNRTQYSYTAWNSIKILIQKELVEKKGTKYSLTEPGHQLAENISDRTNASSVSRDSNLMSEPLSSQENIMTQEPIVERSLIRGSFTIYLIVDNREIRCSQDRTFLSDELLKLGIKLELRSLDLGDFLWIAKHDINGHEIVLDYLIERKTMADLVGSIKDGRFKEQKYRQRNSGIRNIIYLIEDTHMQEAINFGWQKIQTSIVSCQVRDGFFVKRVDNILGVVSYLESMTQLIIEKYLNKDLKSISYLNRHQVPEFLQSNDLMTWSCFCKLNSKSKGMTYGDLWTRQLLVLKGMSLEKASGIVKKYPSCSHLIESIDEFPAHGELGKKLVKLLTESSF